MRQIVEGFEGLAQGLELYPIHRGELLKVFEQGWGNLIGPMFRKIN